MTGEPSRLRMIWCEITSSCQALCLHCYAGSGPGKGHGTMTPGDWEDVITQAADLGAEQVTFIGGEPTLHFSLPRLVRHALDRGLAVEVFSNLIHVAPGLWDLFTQPGVSLATSWYSADRAQHAAITGRDTWRQVRANIAAARDKGIPVRVGVITGIVPGQQPGPATAELRAAGVTSIGLDHLRQFGRGTLPDPSQSCGHCGHGVAAVLPDGTVTPCPMTRWLDAGNAREQSLTAILGEPMTAATAVLPGSAGDCNPKCQPACSPAGLCSPRCNPNSECRPQCGPNCQPQCVPNTSCRPLCTPGACRPRIK